jgi:hypothetical protein
VGDDRVFVFGREPQYFRWTVPLEYRLFAASKVWKASPPIQSSTAKKQRRGEDANSPVNDERNYGWSTKIPILVRAMVLADKFLFVAGPEDLLDESKLPRAPTEDDPTFLAQEAALAGNAGGLLGTVSPATGKLISQVRLSAPPVFDGLIAVGNRLYVTTVAGDVVCLAER